MLMIRTFLDLKSRQAGAEEAEVMATAWSTKNILGLLKMIKTFENITKVVRCKCKSMFVPNHETNFKIVLIIRGGIAQKQKQRLS